MSTTEDTEMKASKDNRFRLREHMVLESDEREAVLIDSRSGTLFALNASAGTLLEALGAGATRDDLVSALTARFDVTADAASRDAREFLDALSAVGAVELIPPGGNGRAPTATRPAPPARLAADTASC